MAEINNLNVLTDKIYREGIEKAEKEAHYGYHHFSYRAFSQDLPDNLWIEEIVKNIQPNEQQRQKV